MPSIMLELSVLRSDVAGSGSVAKTETSICVRGLRSGGLRSGDEVKRFHDIMSQNNIRRLYSGMRLLYDKMLMQ